MLIQNIIKNKEYVLALSFGNYLKGDGGTDKVIAEHQALFNKAGISFVQIAPIKNERGIFGINFYTLVIDGILYSVKSEKELFNFFLELAEQNYGLKAIYIHHLMKFNINFVKKIIDNTDAPIFYYIHDYYTVCNNYRLINSAGMFCGDEPVSEKKCKGCSYFEKSYSHRIQMNDFFNSEAGRITVIAPSKAALDIWKKSFNIEQMKTCVIPHLKANDKHLRNIENNVGRKKIAYVGKMIPTKGAILWDKLVNNQQVAETYDLIYIGNSDYENSNVHNIKVTVTKDTPKLMVETLINNHVDIAILWSTIPETYSYTYYEASEAGCYVITNANSGNIAQSIRDNGNGSIFDKEEDAIDYLNNCDQVISDLQRNAEVKRLSYSPNEEIIDTIGDESFSFVYNKEHCLCETVAAYIVKILYAMKYRKRKH